MIEKLITWGYGYFKRWNFFFLFNVCESYLRHWFMPVRLHQPNHLIGQLSVLDQHPG